MLADLCWFWLGYIPQHRPTCCHSNTEVFWRGEKRKNYICMYVCIYIYIFVQSLKEKDEGDPGSSFWSLRFKDWVNTLTRKVKKNPKPSEVVRRLWSLQPGVVRKGPLEYDALVKSIQAGTVTCTCPREHLLYPFCSLALFLSLKEKFLPIRI